MQASMNILKNKLGYNYNEKGDLFRIDLIKPGKNYEGKTIQEKEYKEDSEIITIKREDGAIVTATHYIFDDKELSKLGELDIVSKIHVKNGNAENIRCYNKYETLITEKIIVDGNIISMYETCIIADKFAVNKYRLDEETNELYLYEKNVYRYNDNKHNNIISSIIKHTKDPELSNLIDQINEKLCLELISIKNSKKEDYVDNVKLLSYSDTLVDKVREFRVKYQNYDEANNRTYNSEYIIIEKGFSISIINIIDDATNELIYEFNPNLDLKCVTSIYNNKNTSECNKIVRKYEYFNNGKKILTYTNDELTNKESFILSNNRTIKASYEYKDGIEILLNKIMAIKFNDGQELIYMIDNNGNLKSLEIDNSVGNPCISVTDSSIEVNSYDDKDNILEKYEFMNLESYSKLLNNAKLNLNIKDIKNN